MQTKVIALPVIFLLCSLCGFSQTPENSSHPLLDKYYPHADTNKTVGSQINPLSNTKAPSTLTNIPAANKPALTAQPFVPPPPQPQPEVTAPPPPPPSTTTVQAITNTSPVNTTPSTQTTLTAVTTPKVNVPTATTVPVSKKPQTPPPPPYMDTRLGSSTKAYDTWEKNNNGAGSVTTSPK